MSGRLPASKIEIVGPEGDFLLVGLAYAGDHPGFVLARFEVSHRNRLEGSVQERYQSYEL